MSLTTYPDLVQGSDEWLEARAGLVTASTVGHLLSVSPPPAISFDCPECGAMPGDPCLSRARKDPAPIKTLHGLRTAPEDEPDVIRVADNEASRGLTMTLVAERITGFVDPAYVSADMWRGTEDEPYARAAYAEHLAPVDELGFMVRTFDGPGDGFSIGYSPDGLVGDDGLIEIKSRRGKTQVQTILDDEVPPSNMPQCQCALLVSGRAWLDYVSFAGGLPLYTKRVYPNPAWHDAILNAVATFEQNVADIIARYKAAVIGLPMTERTDHDLAGIEF